MNRITHLKQIILPFIVATMLAGVAISRDAQAVNPPPDGGYPNFTTAEGDNALKALTTGLANTAVGTFSLFSVTTGDFNTAVGAGSLDLNQADSNTATGAAALLLNTIGTENTAVGTAALEFNDSGSDNTANGAFALFSNTTGDDNTANGASALFFSTGNSNIALGAAAGSNLTTGDSNIYIGNGGAAAESNTIRIGEEGTQTSTFIAGITGIPVTGTAVVVDGSGQLGVAPSSKRFKEEIKPMNNESETILALKPVKFHYKKEIDPAGTPQLGLVAEDVEKVNPDLIVRDKEGKPYTVRYDQVNVMLLNEFLKEHKMVQKQGATIAQQRKDFETALAQQQKQIEALTAGLQKVSAQLEVSKSAPQTVLNNH